MCVGSENADHLQPFSPPGTSQIWKTGILIVDAELHIVTCSSKSAIKQKILNYLRLIVTNILNQMIIRDFFIELNLVAIYDCL